MLSDIELRGMVSRGVIGPIGDEDQVNGVSIDVTLGPILLVEDTRGGTVDLAKRESVRYRRVDMRELPGQRYEMRPGEFLLAHTQEEFNLPLDVAADFKMKSSTARNGLTNALACLCDPGWNGSTLTLELKNYTENHTLLLSPGLRLGQVIFHRVAPVPEERSYRARGRYNGDKAAQGVKE